ncbi:MAG TPA: TetR family transcriptional regulator, partial [Solirubrobacterales bacterium]|nr:TetR family transcriptional regulator [Solirubrobacterales bacterium]
MADFDTGMDRLPRGRHGLSPEYVARNQRERLIDGLISTLHEAGYQQATVSLIGQRAAVSKSDFYKYF